MVQLSSLQFQSRPQIAMDNSNSQVFVIDDDSSVRVALRRLLTLIGFRAEVFGSIEEFLDARREEVPSCLVLDVRLPGMSGLEFQDELARIGMQIPIIFITAQGDSPMTRRAMKAGAVDFLTKPFRKRELLQAIDQALERDKARRDEQTSGAALQSRFEKLTPRECEVLDLVVSGISNKQIGETLGMTEATVKIHRRRVMEKMQASSLPDLVRMSEKVKGSLRR